MVYKNQNRLFQIIPVILLSNHVAVFSSNAGNQVYIGLAKPNNPSPYHPHDFYHALDKKNLEYLLANNDQPVGSEYC